MIPPEELRHLISGPLPGEEPGGVGLVVVAAVCAGDAESVRARIQSVLATVVDHQQGPWPSLDEWQQLLPAWFLDACADEMSQEQAEAWVAWWRSLPADQQAVASQEQVWTLADWLYWLEPAERQWFVWHLRLACADRIRVSVEVAGWPAPLGSLQWLLRAAGAVDVVVETQPST